MAQDDATQWAVAAQKLEEAVAACRASDDTALDRLALRLEAELIDLRFQRSAADA